VQVDAADRLRATLDLLLKRWLGLEVWSVICGRYETLSLARHTTACTRLWRSIGYQRETCARRCGFAARFRTL